MPPQRSIGEPARLWAKFVKISGISEISKISRKPSFPERPGNARRKINFRVEIIFCSKQTSWIVD